MFRSERRRGYSFRGKKEKEMEWTLKDGTTTKKFSHKISDTFRYIWMDELALFESIVETLPINPLCVVIGTGPGTATISILETREDAKVYSIDIDPPGWEKGHATEAGLSNRLNQIQGNSSDVGDEWDKGKIDLLFVDGDHTPEQVQKDIDAWLLHVRLGGYVFYHDYIPDVFYGLVGVVDKEMQGYEQVGWARGLIAFRVGEEI
jgi:hypothetical protein